MTKANVDCKEDGRDDDADGSQDTDDSVDYSVDGQQLVDSLVPRRSATYSAHSACGPRHSCSRVHFVRVRVQ